MDKPSAQRSRLSLRRSTLTAVVALTFAISACSDDDTADSNAVAAATPEAASLVAATASGGQLDFGTLEGQDFVLWFWAPW